MLLHSCTGGQSEQWKKRTSFHSTKQTFLNVKTVIETRCWNQQNLYQDIVDCMIGVCVLGLLSQSVNA